ncbi:hypothetical protein PR202_gb07974 [Eleusine coracana subsp. coracana]|uniref:Uncharacterized protein n=1 Tax=Eleusine coracana subsp. coracana TaxID=191504 RepID=A0AAV5ECS0_ELECO|nr:hypothetical protein PR202_gb07974 [Eleusine coracana subsp. coracana]
MPVLMEWGISRNTCEDAKADKASASVSSNNDYVTNNAGNLFSVIVSMVSQILTSVKAMLLTHVLEYAQINQDILIVHARRGKQWMSTTGPSSTLRELSLPSPDVLVHQSSDEKAMASSYVLNPIIISMAEANKFFGVKEENPYTHLQDLETLCQTFHHEGVPQDLYRWLLFPFSLGGIAKEWHKAASREAKDPSVRKTLPKPELSISSQVITSTVELEVIMADGGKTKPLGVIKNVEIEISSKTILVDFFILDNKETGVEDIILGRPFLRLVQGVLDARKALGELDPDGAPEVEQKELLKELRYEYLGRNRTYLVILNNALMKEETEKLLAVLKRYKKAIGYTLDDIKGISPSFCTHKINLEENAKPVVEGM